MVLSAWKATFSAGYEPVWFPAEQSFHSAVAFVGADRHRTWIDAFVARLSAWKETTVELLSACDLNPSISQLGVVKEFVVHPSASCAWAKNGAKTATKAATNRYRAILTSASEAYFLSREGEDDKNFVDGIYCHDPAGPRCHPIYFI